ncbi:MAG: GH25 family lysozyme [Pseudomonadota bacterium]
MRPFVFIALALALVACTSSQVSIDQVLTTRATAETGRLPYGDSDPVDEWEGGGPFGFAVHGVDVAKWQRDVNWQALARQNIRFAFIKATEGGDLLDDRFSQNWRGAAQAGIPRGAYHFYYFCTSAAVQARWFIQNVPKQSGALPPVLDMEWNSKSPTCRLRPPPATVRSEMRIWLDMVKRHYGKQPLIYTTVDFHRENLAGHFPNEVFWLRSVKAHPRVTYPGRPWTFWQYTGTGRIEGQAGDIDINVFGGNERKWRDWLQTALR